MKEDDDITFQIKGHTYLLVQTSTLSPEVKIASSFQTIVRYCFKYLLHIIFS